MINWTPEIRKVAELKELPNNPRKIKGDAFDKLKARISARGFHDVIKVDTEGYILSGNQRKRALLELGFEEVTVLVPDRPLTQEERDYIVLESNRTDGQWDDDILANNFDIELLKDAGFSDAELGIVSFRASKEDDMPSCSQLKELWRQGKLGGNQA